MRLRLIDFVMHRRSRYNKEEIYVGLKRFPYEFLSVQWLAVPVLGSFTLPNLSSFLLRWLSMSLPRGLMYLAASQPCVARY